MLLACFINLKTLGPVELFTVQKFLYGKLRYFLTKIYTIHKIKTKAKFNNLLPTKLDNV